MASGWGAWIVNDSVEVLVVVVVEKIDVVMGARVVVTVTWKVVGLAGDRCVGICRF